MPIWMLQWKVPSAASFDWAAHAASFKSLALGLLINCHSIFYEQRYVPSGVLPPINKYLPLIGSAY